MEVSLAGDYRSARTHGARCSMQIILSRWRQERDILLVPGELAMECERGSGCDRRSARQEPSCRAVSRREGVASLGGIHRDHYPT